MNYSTRNVRLEAALHLFIRLYVNKQYWRECIHSGESSNYCETSKFYIRLLWLQKTWFSKGFLLYTKFSYRVDLVFDLLLVIQDHLILHNSVSYKITVGAFKNIVPCLKYYKNWIGLKFKANIRLNIISCW